MLVALGTFVASLALSWYLSSLLEGHGSTDVTRELAPSLFIVILSSALLWEWGPSPLGFGLIIGSGWYFLNRTVDMIFPV
ncbi:MAG: hypothetical protein QGI73_00980 [Candidatus Thalassarchaeaceae archaeon]|jgi:hypothetical protein|nr:hypothetical protein [Candidatus Thalassarchaeaceae archaeon]